MRASRPDPFALDMIWLKPTAIAAVALSVIAQNPVATTVKGGRPPLARAASDTAPRAERLDSTLAIATFDSAWRTVGVALEGRGVTRVDWAQVRRELRPRAARATSDTALRAVIDDMLSRIGESHFAILPPPPVDSDGGTSSTLGTAGAELRVLDAQLVVWHADSGGAARRAGMAPGWVVERIGDYRVPTLSIADTIGPRRLAVLTGGMRAFRGAPGAPVRVVARDAEGTRREVWVTLDSMRGPMSKFGNLPPLPATFSATRRTLSDGQCVGLIRFEYWLPPVMPALDRAVDSVRTCAGIVIDLRGNLGGVAGMMMGVAGHFLTEPRTLGIMRTRGDEMRFVANPRFATDAGVSVRPFEGRLAIVVDGLSASTSEMFAAAMQALGRARVFGERTAGQALPAMATRLPTGDVLMHVVADFVAPDGSSIEGRGVFPDEPVPLTRRDVLTGRDAPLEAALRWIEQARPTSQ
jgi:carboxyl-terminal processing protease